MKDLNRRATFRLLGAALLAGAVTNGGEAEAQPYYDPYNRPPPPPPPPHGPGWGPPPPPPPPGYGPRWRRRCWWRETPWGPRKVCR
jgi:hypothetical protein